MITFSIVISKAVKIYFPSFVFGSLYKMGKNVCKQILHIQFGWSGGYICLRKKWSEKQFPILDLYHISQTYLTVIRDVTVPTPPTSPSISLFKKTVKNALLIFHSGNSLTYLN